MGYNQRTRHKIWRKSGGRMWSNKSTVSRSFGGMVLKLNYVGFQLKFL